MRTASRHLTARWRALANSPAAARICFLWAVAEATVWPVIPDVALMTLAFASPRRAPRLFAATLAGSVLGGCVILLVTAAAPNIAGTIVTNVPLVHSASVPVVSAYLHSHSLLQSFLFQPWSGIPFKLWAVTAAVSGANPAGVVASFVLGRGLRFAAGAVVATAAGRLLEKRLPRIALPLLVVCGPAAAYVFYVIAIAG